MRPDLRQVRVSGTENDAGLTLEVEPGTRLLVEIGKRETCATTVTVSYPFAPQLKPMPFGTMLAPVDTHR